MGKLPILTCQALFTPMSYHNFLLPKRLGRTDTNNTPENSLEVGVPKETPKQIRQSIISSSILGQDSFVEQLTSRILLKRRTRRMGRPKKVPL